MVYVALVVTRLCLKQVLPGFDVPVKKEHNVSFQHDEVPIQSVKEKSEHLYLQYKLS